MMEAMQLWILTAVVTAMGAILSYAFKTSLAALVRRIETLVAEVRKLTAEVVGHHHRLDGLDDKVKEANSRLNKLSERMRTVEDE